MRLSVRPGVRTRLRREFSRTIHRAPKLTESVSLFRRTGPSLRANRFQGATKAFVVNTHRQRVLDLCRVSSHFLFALPQRPRPGAGILTGFPFDRRSDQGRASLATHAGTTRLLNGVSLSLRSGSLTFNKSFSRKDPDRSRMRLAALPSHFHCALAVCHPKTRAYVRLLGPCSRRVV